MEQPNVVAVGGDPWPITIDQMTKKDPGRQGQQKKEYYLASKQLTLSGYV